MANVEEMTRAVLVDIHRILDKSSSKPSPGHFVVLFILNWYFALKQSFKCTSFNFHYRCKRIPVFRNYEMLAYSTVHNHNCDCATLFAHLMEIHLRKLFHPSDILYFVTIVSVSIAVLSLWCELVTIFY